MKELKQKLLKTGYFIDNEWLDNYCFLIKSNKETVQQQGITQKHHILQKAYFNIIQNAKGQDEKIILLI